MHIIDKDGHPDTSKKIKVHVYDSLSEMAEHAEAIPPRYQDCMNRRDWNKVGQRAECIKLLWEGDAKLLREVKENLSGCLNLLAPLTKKRARRTSPFGTLQVPAFLMGHPTPCKRRVKLLSTQGPVRIWMDMTTSCAISAEELMSYRMIISSFAAALTNLRQVELNAFSINQAWGGPGVAPGIVVPVPLRPLDAVSVSTIAHVGIYRGLMLDKLKEIAESPGDGLMIFGSSKNHAVYLGAKRGDIITPQITPSILWEIMGNRTPQEAVEKLMKDYLSGKGFVFETIDEVQERMGL